MGASQIGKMVPSLSEVYEGISGPDDAPHSCCTLEAVTPSGSEVWIQAMPGTVNMAFPFAEEPVGLLRSRGVRSPAGLYLVEWAAGEYATLGFGDIPPRDHASFVDQLFVKVLGCDDAGYEVKATIERLDA